MFFIAMRFIVFSSLILRNTSSGLNVTVGILAPLTGARVLGESMYHMVEDSFLLIKSDSRFSEIQKHDVNFIYKFRDTGCDIGQGLYELVAIMDFQSGAEKEIDTFIGKLLNLSNYITICNST